MDPREENFFTEMGCPFEFRAHNEHGIPILVMTWDQWVLAGAPGKVVADGLTYFIQSSTPSVKFRAKEPGPIIPGQPYNMQPKFRHEPN